MTYSLKPLLLAFALLTSCNTTPQSPPTPPTPIKPEQTVPPPTPTPPAPTLPSLTPATPLPSLAPPTPSAPPAPSQPSAPVTEFGIHINACDNGTARSLPIVLAMKLTWVKLQVRWGDMQRGPDDIDWRCFDAAIPAINRAGLKLLASVVTAPQYLRRASRGMNGPPDNFDEYARFLEQLIARYPKQIHAIEIWNEPNLAREWDWMIDGAVYRHLLVAGYAAVKRSNPDIMVISGALAPTAFAGVWEHVDDLGFLRKFRRYSGDAYADCIGAHANGPDGAGDIQAVVPRYFELFERRKPICVTEFGYAVPFDNQAPPGFEWIMSYTPERRAVVLAEGQRWAVASGMVRLVIIWNLDYGGGPRDPNAVYALERSR